MSQPAPPPAKKPRRWIGVPYLLLAILAGGLGYLFVRGSWADDAATDPTSPEQGPITRLLKTDDVRITVRSAMVLNHPREKVWALVTDYANYGDVLPYVKDIAATAGDGGTVVSGKAASAISGYWDFAMTVRETRGEAWSATWDAAPTGDVLVNRGGWTLRELSPGTTLLELRLEVEAKGYPRFFLRNFFLYRLGRVLQAIDEHLDEVP